MLESYKIVNEKNEDVLYLYLTMRYEFSEDIEEVNKKWLKKQRIKFEGDKVVLIVDGIPTKVIHLNKDEIQSDKENLVLLDNNEAVTMEAFLLSCLFKNIQINMEKEALKAVVVLYRSEALLFKKLGKKIKEQNPNFSYTNLNYYKLSNPKTYEMYYNKYMEAIKETDGEFLTYQKTPIEAYLHIASNGYTEEDHRVPYLVKKESFWDMAYPYYMNQNYFSVDTLREKLSLGDENIEIKINQISNSNRILELQIGSRILSARDLMIHLSLPSSDATILVLKDGFNFITRGIGSGYGLSLVGSNALSNLDYNYRQILGYYFKDVVLNTKNTKS